MTFQIEVPSSVLFKLFESSSISTGMVHEVPGGATIELGVMPMEKRHVPGAEPLVAIAVTCGVAVATNVFSAWLYDKLKNAGVRKIKIERAEVEVTKEGITRAVTEKIEIEQ